MYLNFHCSDFHPMKKPQINLNTDESSKSNISMLDYGGFVEELLRLISINGTVQYLIKRTGKGKKLLSVYLNRLCKQGRIARVSRGYYRSLTSAPCGMMKSNTSYKPVNVIKPYHIHDLQIKLLHTLTAHEHITKFAQASLPIRFNIQNGCNYLNLDTIWMIGKDNIHIQFPRDFELPASDTGDATQAIHNAIVNTLSKGEEKFKLSLYKDGRINYTIVNLHIAYRENELSKVLQLQNINHVVVRDPISNNERFVIDWSKGVPEVEFKDAMHALPDAEHWQEWLKALRDDEWGMMKSIQVQHNRSIMAIMDKLDMNPKPTEELEVGDTQLSLRDNYFG